MLSQTWPGIWESHPGASRLQVCNKPWRLHRTDGFFILKRLLECYAFKAFWIDLHKTAVESGRADGTMLQCQIKNGLEILVRLGMHMGIIYERRAFQRGLKLFSSSTQSKVSLKITFSIGFWSDDFSAPRSRSSKQKQTESRREEIGIIWSNLVRF